MRVLFAGPSIYGLDLRNTDGLVVRPPAACGDVLTAVRAGAQSIGIIDGIFGSEASVWHKEILFALSKGVRVFGAASMGALRAAECHPFGMIGVGRIFAAYRDGKRTADSDVALLHGPAEMNFRPLTVALVDVEASLEALARHTHTPEHDLSRLARTAAQMHFSERTWPALIAKAGVRLPPLESFKVDLKALDAQELIALMVSPRSRMRRPAVAPWTFNRTLFLAALERRLDA